MNEMLENVGKEILPWFASHGFRILITIVLAIVVNFLLNRMVARIVRLSVTAGRQKSEEAEEKRERTLIRVTSWAIFMMTTIIASMMILQEIGLPIGPMLAGAGIVGLAVGFGGQYLIRDYITGLLIIFENQYHIGDMVKLDDTEGTVEDISLRMTTLRDMDGTVHHVPHGDIKRVSNLSKYFSRINLNVNISYNADIEDVIQVVNQVGLKMANEPRWKPEIIKAPQFLRVDDFTDTAVSIKIVGETIPNRQFMVTGELRKRIKEAFDEHGIQMLVIQHIVRRVESSTKDESEQ
jgi:small-conductance mechanosensitive channel